jgi:SnoaL-like protein
VELWEVTAREQIRDSLARYNWSGDALRLDELTLAFCEEGELELRGEEPLRGRGAIVEFLGGGAEPVDDEARRAARNAETAASGVKRIVRHNLANVRFLELTREQALVASYFTVLTEIGLDHYGRYRDTFVPVGDEWLIRHRYVSVDWRAEGSTMAPRGVTSS